MGSLDKTHVVETNVRGLKALGVPQESYGALLSSVDISKLPPEIRLIASREMDEEDWDIKEMMEVMEREIQAREQSKNPTVEYKYTPHSQLAVDGCNFPSHLCVLQWTTSISILFHGEGI